MKADENKTNTGRKKKPTEALNKSGAKAKSTENIHSQNEEQARSGTEIHKGTESDSLSIFSALSIADSNDDAALKKLHTEIPKEAAADDQKEKGAQAGATSVPKQFAYTPEHILDGRKAVKANYDSDFNGYTYVSNADAYADVTAKVLAERVAAEKTQLPAQQDERYSVGKTDGKQADKRRSKALKGKQQQAFADYVSEGAITDAIARNEFHLRARNASARKKKVLAVSILVIVALMLLTFGISVIVSTIKGFTVNLTGADRNKGLTLFSSYDAVKQGLGVSRLTAKDIPKCDNQTFSELKDAMVQTIDKGDGEQSKEFYYFAYSFYVQNIGQGEVDYEFRLNMTATSRGVDDAVRIALIEDSGTYLTQNNQRILSVTGKPATDPATGRWLYKDGVPVMQRLYDPEGNLYPPEKQDNAQPFYSNTTVLYRKKTNFGFQAGFNTHKYTVVIYLEGGDDDCKSSIRGGGIKFSAEMTVTDYRIHI